MAKLTQTEIRRRHFSRYGDAKNFYQSNIEPTHRLIRDFLSPHGARFASDDNKTNEGLRMDENIIDSTAVTASEIMVAGIFGGVTSAADKWFRLTIDNPALKEQANVKRYFDDVTGILLTDLAKSNFYTSAATLYSSMVDFGTGTLQIDPDPDTVFRFIPFTIGKYYIANDHRGLVSEVSRVFSLRARDIIEKFGEENVSTRVKESASIPSNGNKWFDILHIQERNTDRDVTKLDSKNKAWLSIYYELKGTDDEPPLREMGYDSQPFAAVRYSTTGDEAWGGGPGERTLGDNMSLQAMSSDGLVAVEKEIDGPLVAKGFGEDVTIDAGAGGVTYIDDVTTDASLEPLYKVNPDLRNLEFYMESIRNRIKDGFKSSLFFALANKEKQQTAFEIAQIQQEQLRLFGPLMERLSPDFTRIVIARIYALEESLGRLPEPPVEIEGQDVKVELISLIAQAQASQSIAPINQTVSTAVEMSDRWPEVLKKIDPMQVIDEIAQANGTPSSIIVDDETVAAQEAAEAAELDRQQDIAETQEAIDGAQKLSQTDTGGDNALTSLLGGGA